MQRITRYITLINITLLGLSPIFLLLLVYLDKGILTTPWWARGIFVSWAFTFNLWVGIGALFKKRLDKITTLGFLTFNFVLPAISFYFNRSSSLAFYQIINFHFLSLAVATFVLVIIGPFVEKQVNEEFWVRLSWKKHIEKKSVLALLGLSLFGLIVFGLTLLLPAIWAEMVVLENSHISSLILIRYITMAINSYYIFKVLYPESIYD